MVTLFWNMVNMAIITSVHLDQSALHNLENVKDVVLRLSTKEIKVSAETIIAEMKKSYATFVADQWRQERAPMENFGAVLVMESWMINVKIPGNSTDIEKAH